ncbi:MAG: restriction endonuclease subunit S, partial [Sphaerochaetaceae bacterium]|nr:restriction endonuclease subunit S [Sphaerochaetaceae bacterium]
MEVKPGYKQTEIGVIPEDWEVYTIQELIDQGCILYHMDGNHGSFYPRNKEFKTHGVPYIGANDFEQGSVSFLKCKYLSYHRASSMKKGIARDGDILFAHNATVGPVARLNTEYPFVILSTSATAYRTDNIRLFNEWLLYIMQSDFFVRQYTANMSQTTRNQVPITMQRKLLVPVSRPDEQNLIAAVLSNIDSFITSLEKLIKKKKLIKQGVMQELLIGKRRLPGFRREWETKRLGDVSVVIMGQSPDSKYYNTDSKGIP